MQIDRDTIIKEIQRVAQEKGVKQLTRSEFSAESEISSWQIYQVFDGWREACELAGLEPYYQNIPIDDDVLFEEMRCVFLSYGSICTRTKFQKLSKYSIGPYKRRFGGWQEILFAFRQWLEHGEVEFPFIDRLPSISNGKVTKSKSRKPGGQTVSKVQHGKGIGGATYGRLLNFPGLQHGPINEQGVVLLFGMVCSELGFVVEAVRTDYPDCEAKRRVGRKPDEWERVRIEFEFRSSHFKKQGHKPELCDIIVCWEHDWPECPLEVIELKSVIKTLNE
jgi:hypothetical protein